MSTSSSCRAHYRSESDIRQFEGKKLTEIINSEHENKKYLPGVMLGDNVRAIPDIGEAVKDATVLIFVMPHQCKLHVPSWGPTS
jgi:glycerol-3-phosphate dehydrogenase